MPEGADGTVAICPYCSVPTVTDNTVWCLCESCNEKIWLDFSHPYAPPKIGIKKKREAMSTGWPTLDDDADDLVVDDDDADPADAPEQSSLVRWA